MSKATDAMKDTTARDWLRWVRHPREAADAIFGAMFGRVYQWWARRNPADDMDSRIENTGGAEISAENAQRGGHAGGLGGGHAAWMESVDNAQPGGKAGV